MLRFLRLAFVFFTFFLVLRENIFAQTKCNINIIRKDVNEFKKLSVNLARELEKTESSKIKIIIVRGYKRPGGKYDYILPICNSISSVDTTKLDILSYECPNSLEADNDLLFIDQNGNQIKINFKNHATFLLIRNLDLLKYIKRRIDLNTMTDNDNILINKDNLIKSDSTHVEQLKYLTTYLPFLIYQFEIEQRTIRENENLKPVLELGWFYSGYQSDVLMNDNETKTQNNQSVPWGVNLTINLPFKQFANSKLGLSLGISNYSNTYKSNFAIQNFKTQYKIDYQDDRYLNLLNSNSVEEAMKMNICKLNVDAYYEANLNKSFQITLGAGFYNDINYKHNYSANGSIKVQRIYPKYSDQPIFDNVYENLYQDARSVINSSTVNLNSFGVDYLLGLKYIISDKINLNINYRGEFKISNTLNNGESGKYFESTLYRIENNQRFNHFLLVKIGVKI